MITKSAGSPSRTRLPRRAEDDSATSSEMRLQVAADQHDGDIPGNIVELLDCGGIRPQPVSESVAFNSAVGGQFFAR